MEIYCMFCNMYSVINMEDNWHTKHIICVDYGDKTGWSEELWNESVGQ